MIAWLTGGALAVFLLAPKAAAAAKGVVGMDRWTEEIKAAGKRHGAPWRMGLAIMGVESSWGEAASVKRGLENPGDVDASKSSDGKSWGLMQVTLPTADWLAPGTSVRDLNNPAISIDLGMKYIGYLFKRFKGDVEKTVRAYNGGPGFETTKLGPSLTALYYTKYKAALAAVLSRYPGSETEV